MASLAFSTSVPQIAQRLCDIFPLDKVHLARTNLDRQANLLARCAGHMFAPRASFYDAPTGEESLMMSSLTLLSLKAELEELNRNNSSLKKEKQRLEKCIVDLSAQLQEEKANVQCTWSSKPSVVKALPRATVVSGRGPQQPSRSTHEREYLSDAEDEMDPNLQLALKLQATFDSENDLLLKQKHEIMQTAQLQYHCGVCLDDFPEDDAVHIDSCGHEICRDCARGHVCSKIEEHRFPVLCPVCMADQRNQDPGSKPRRLCIFTSDWC